MDTTWLKIRMSYLKNQVDIPAIAMVIVAFPLGSIVKTARRF